MPLRRRRELLEGVRMSDGNLFLQAVEMIRGDIRDLDRKVTIRIERVEDRTSELGVDLARVAANQARADKDLEAGAADIRSLTTSTTELRSMIEAATRSAVGDAAPRRSAVAGLGVAGYGLGAALHGLAWYVWQVWKAAGPIALGGGQ